MGAPLRQGAKVKKGGSWHLKYVKICKGQIAPIWPFFMQLPKGNFHPYAGFINLEERCKMKLHLGLLAGRKERHMKITKLLSHALLIFAIAFPLSTFALAQDDQAPDQDQNQNQPDPPSRVGRVNMVQGSVSFQPGGEGDWLMPSLTVL